MPKGMKLTSEQKEQVWKSVTSMGRVFIIILGILAIIMCLAWITQVQDSRHQKKVDDERHNILRKELYGEYTLDEKFEKYRTSTGITVTSSDGFSHRDWLNKKITLQWYDPDTLSIDKIKLNMEEAWTLAESTNKARRSLGLEVLNHARETNMIRLLKSKWKRQEKKQ